MNHFLYSCYRIERTTAFLLLLLPVVLMACGSQEDEWTKKRPKVFKTEGVVSESGRPLADAIILFHPVAGEFSGRAVTDAKGKYRMTTFKDFDGATEGEFRVTIEKVEWVLANPDKQETADSDEQASGSGPIKKIPLSNEKYADPKKSGFTANITPKGPNRFDFDLEPREK